MNNFGRCFAASLFALFMAMPGWSTPVLTLLPSGSIGGLPGQQIGWGFSITNDADYIEITSAQFCLTPVSFPACAEPMQGLFTDFISQFNSIIVGNPGGTLPDTVSQDFDAILLTGVGSFDIAPGAPFYSADFGQIVLTYNVYDADPDGVDGANQLLSDQVLLASAAVFVTDQPVMEPVPEPSSVLLAAGGVLALLASRSRR